LVVVVVVVVVKVGVGVTVWLGIILGLNAELGEIEDAFEEVWRSGPTDGNAFKLAGLLLTGDEEVILCPELLCTTLKLLFLFIWVLRCILLVKLGLLFIKVFVI
jgi:hypothetical protein